MTCYFDPTPFKPRAIELALEDHKLVEAELKEYALQVIAIRKVIVERALVINTLTKEHSLYQPKRH